MKITEAERTEMAAHLTDAGIIDADQATSTAVLLARAPSPTYREWRASLASLGAGRTEAAVAADLARTYGNDAVRAAHALSRRAWS